MYYQSDHTRVFFGQKCYILERQKNTPDHTQITQSDNRMNLAISETLGYKGGQPILYWNSKTTLLVRKILKKNSDKNYLRFCESKKINKG